VKPESTPPAVLALDVGGTTIKSALVLPDGFLLDDPERHEIDGQAPADTVLEQFAHVLRRLIDRSQGRRLLGIAVAMPGPFDYERGVSLMHGLGKFDAIAGVPLAAELATRVPELSNLPWRWINDASAFALGELRYGAARGTDRAMFLTLGTGCGSAFAVGGQLVTDGPGVPPNGYVYPLEHQGWRIDDVLSQRGVMRLWHDGAAAGGNEAQEGANEARDAAEGAHADGAEAPDEAVEAPADPAAIAALALTGNDRAKTTYRRFGELLATALAPVFSVFRPDLVVLAGQISRSFELFGPAAMEAGAPPLRVASDLDGAALKGAASLLLDDHHRRPAGAYDPFPALELPPGQIERDLDALARRIANESAVIIDGYIGVLWNDLRRELDHRLQLLGVDARWQPIDVALRPEAEIEHLVAPFLGGNDPIFGHHFDGTLADFFDAAALAALRPDPDRLTILYGCGAALAGWSGPLLYVDLPKDTLQQRSRAGLVTNLGRTQPDAPKPMYKRFYFVDWPALNRHKQRLLPDIDVILDGQDATNPNFMTGTDLRNALRTMSRSYLRARPWFEPGPWGGQWLKRMIPQLPQDAPNYAWSFELITPENGLTLESGGERLEVSFDMLMFQEAGAVLGEHAERFGTSFPIRFDYLDTMEGGNLSLQCHPSPGYIEAEFGEPYTQDETYYILDCAPGARVYLGFQEGVNPSAFRASLEESARSGAEVDVERFVRTLPAERHDLFLIPHGTVHCSGAGNMVLEISATPYIFTFKLYDWLRLDLDGHPRPLNVERAFANLDFSRQGSVVDDSLVSRPRTIREGDGWRLVHLPTHPVHFYDVHRIELTTAARITTDGSPHVLNVVEGGPVLLRTADGSEGRFCFAETFVVPAAAGAYELVNEGAVEAKVIKAFLKPVG
jgi:predicted NBD/HSP70 family sugar kinase/mannose-6-phosphate isomerase class I